MSTGAQHAVCLCADWCGTCRAYRSVFDELAARHPAVRFHWLDVEAAEAALDDYEVETFPTLLLAAGGSVRFLGPLLPQAGVLDRLLQRLQDTPPLADGDAAALWQRVARTLSVSDKAD